MKYSFKKKTIDSNLFAGCSESSLPTNLTLLRATEIEEVLNGNDDKYRATTISTESTTTRMFVV
mgnify:CR=1 FL=1